MDRMGDADMVTSRIGVCSVDSGQSHSQSRGIAQMVSQLLCRLSARSKGDLAVYPVRLIGIALFQAGLTLTVEQKSERINALARLFGGAAQPRASLAILDETALSSTILPC